MKKVLLLGSSGFVGQHIAEALRDSTQLITTTRDASKTSESQIYFDFQDTNTWSSIVTIIPDIIINASGYGVVKEQTDLTSMFAVNYQAPMRLAEHIQQARINPVWMQIGTAFEYDLDAETLTENSETLPGTHYGMSKLLFSTYLTSKKNRLQYTLLRPFAMFGPYESASKIVPYLVGAQINRNTVYLSSGLQFRDYLYVKDLAYFVKQLIDTNQHAVNSVFNVASGCPVTLRMLAKEISLALPEFDENFWQWGQVPQRANESDIFYNTSYKAKAAGLLITSQAEAIKQTVQHYLANR